MSISLDNLYFPPLQRYNCLNVFEQLKPKEIEHSLVLFEILNPNGKHGYKDEFLKLFFEYVIENEIAYNDSEEWVLTVEKNRYDLEIKSIDDSIVIIIENKSNYAKDGEHQLYYYWDWEINKKNNYRCNKGMILYLSPNSNKLPDEQTKCSPSSNDEPMDDIVKVVFFHEHILKWLDKCIEKVEKKSEIYFYLKQYKDFWRINMGYDIDEINKHYENNEEQWFSFIDLIEKKEEIKNRWWRKFFNDLKNIKSTECWDFKKLSDISCCWFIKDFKTYEEKSFCLYIYLNGKAFALTLASLNDDKNKLIKISKFLKNNNEKQPNEDGIKLENQFNRLNYPIIKNDQKIKYEEFCSFDISNEKIDNTEKLAWYANFEPKELYEQIEKKLQKFFDPKISEIIIKINKEVFKD